MSPLTSSDPSRTTSGGGTDADVEVRQQDERLDPQQVDEALAVLGMLAFSELAAFSRLAADAGMAPNLEQRLELSRLAGVALDRLDLVAARVVELGGELRPVMTPFAGLLTEFDERTVPRTWWERLLKAYVGYGVADDFARIVARAVDPRTRDLVVEALSDDGHAALVVESLAAACATDATLASRLALWGRRLFGEALGVVQGVIAHHPELQGLLEASVADLPGTGEPPQRLYAALTADHSRRMERLGLTP